MPILIVIDDIVPRTQLIASAGQTVFNTNWTADVASDIVVFARPANTDANDITELVSSSNYNVTFIGSTRTVRVTFLSGRTEGDIITIVRATPADRQNLYTNTNFNPAMLNQDFGLLTLIDQQNQMYNQNVNFRLNISEEIDPQTADHTGDLVFPKAGPRQIYRKTADGKSWEVHTLSDFPAPTNAPYLIYSEEASLPDAQNLGLLDAGLLWQDKNGEDAILRIAENAVDYWAPGDALTRSQAPVNPTDVTNKEYVDATASGFNIKDSVTVATNTNFTATYDNGSSGVNATLTATSVGALSFDGYAVALNDTVLVKNQTNSYENGWYVVSVVGDGVTQGQLLRSTQYDTPAQIQRGDLFTVLEGNVNQYSMWLQTAAVTDIGVDPIVFTEFGIAATNIVTISGTQTITGDKEFTGVVEVPTPATETEAANKGYVDSYVGGGGIAKNLIIGGDFTTNPWQFGTSFPGALWVSGDYNADRFFAAYSTTGVTTISRVADAPTVAQAGILATECLQIAVTTADATIGASEFYLLGQRIEGYNFSRIAQRPFTLSFWVKFSKTGTYCVSFKNTGVDRSYVAEFSVDAANTWEKKIITVPASPSGGTWNYSSGIGLQILWMIACGTNLQTTPNSWQTGSFNATSNQVNGLDSNTNTFRIALIQCEPGEVATPFEIRNEQQELAMCQRYLWKTFPQGTAPAGGTATSGSIIYRAQITGTSGPVVLPIIYPVVMRATPDIQFYNPSVVGSSTWRNFSTVANSAAGSISGASDRGFGLGNAQVAGDNAGNLIGIHLTARAEL